MYDLSLAFELTMAWRNVDTPFDARCRAIEPVIDTYLAQGRSLGEADWLSQSRRLVATAGLDGRLGPHVGRHVVRRTAEHLAETSPRFVMARQLVERLCVWPEISLAWPQPRQSAPNRRWDQWAIMLAAHLSPAKLEAAVTLWQYILGSLTLPQPDAVPEPEWCAELPSLTPAETRRLMAIEKVWSRHFVGILNDAAQPLRPPPLPGPGDDKSVRHARRVLAAWSRLPLPPHGHSPNMGLGPSPVQQATRLWHAVFPKPKRRT